MTTPCELLIPTNGPKKGGVDTKIWPEHGPLFFANAKSYGGSEKVSNGLLVIEDTMVITTWYRPDIAAKCRVRLVRTGEVYEIINKPENLENRNQCLVFKLRRVMGNG